jgi:Holliday junction resolvase RusA-like endonuclease
MLNETILGKPKAQPRVKAYSRGGKAGVYTPSTADEWRRTVKAGLARHASKKLSGAFEVELDFFLDRPRSHFRTGKYSHILKSDVPKYHTKKPDVDNFAKLILDVLSKIEYWEDDSQVVSLRVTKQYADVFDQGVRIVTRVI